MLRIIRVISLVMLTVLLFTCVCACADVTERKSESISAYMLNTGKSDCIMLVGEGKTVLIDTAGAESVSEVCDAVERLGGGKIDILFLTHFDTDHIGGAPELIVRYAPEKVITPDYVENSVAYRALISALNSAKSTELVKIKADMTYDAGSFTLTCDAPDKTTYSDDNDYSFVLFAQCGDKKLLFCGDATALRMSEFISAYGSEGYDLVKLPHHGKGSDTLGEFIGDCGAQYYVVCTDSIATVDAQTLIAVSSAGGGLYFTYNGTVCVTCDGSNLSLEQ